MQGRRAIEATVPGARIAGHHRQRGRGHADQAVGAHARGTPVVGTFVADQQAEQGQADPERDREANIANARANRAAVEASERALDALRARLPDPRDHGPPGEVPRMFHFVWLNDQPQGDIPYYAAIAIRSARHFNPGWAAFYYCNHEPEGPNWDRVRPDVTVVRLDDFRFFRNAELHHYAHKADVIRLIVINQCGGVYLDLDTITRKSFEDLRKHNFCMGVQADCHGVGSGLCNAVLVGQPGAQFSTRWLEQYDYFRSRGKDLLWAETRCDDRTAADRAGSCGQ